MLKGIAITIGVILVIASRFLYGFWDMGLGGDSDNDAKGTGAIVCDIVGTLLIIYSVV